MLAPLLVNPSPLTRIIDNTKGKAPRTLSALLEQFPEAGVKTGEGEGRITGNQEEPALIVVLGQDYVTRGSGQK